MYRWRIRLTHPDGPPEPVTVEVPARGANYTLRRLGRVGHPIHLSLVDAHLSGEVRLPADWALGRDSQVVAANLLGPSIWLYRSRVDEATLHDLHLLPPQPDGQARYRIRSGGASDRVLATMQEGSAAADWAEVAVALPGARGNGRVPGPITVAARAPTSAERVGNGPAPVGRIETSRAEARAWEHVQERLGFRLTERRKEPIAVRVIGQGRSTTLLVGWSLVLPRNQVLFAAWLGSDGRLELRPAIRKRSK